MDLSDVPAPTDIDHSAEAGDRPTWDTVSHLFRADKAGRRATLCDKQVDGPEAPRNASSGCDECMSEWNRSKIVRMLVRMTARRLGTPTLGWEPLFDGAGLKVDRKSLPPYTKVPVSDVFIHAPRQPDPSEADIGRDTYLACVQLGEFRREFSTRDDAVAWVQKVLSANIWEGGNHV